MLGPPRYRTLSNGTLAAIKPIIYKSHAKLNGEKETCLEKQHDTATEIKAFAFCV
jgi:hypothetical protein